MSGYRAREARDAYGDRIAAECEQAAPRHPSAGRRHSENAVAVAHLPLDHPHAWAAGGQAECQVVREAEGDPVGGEDAAPLLDLVAEVLLAVEIHLLASDRPILLDHPGPLARYERIDLLTRLRDPVGRRGRCPAMLVLAAGDEQSDLPLIDGREVPLITSGQRARVSLTWVENQHRAAI